MPESISTKYSLLSLFLFVGLVFVVLFVYLFVCFKVTEEL